MAKGFGEILTKQNSNGNWDEYFITSIACLIFNKSISQTNNVIKPGLA